MSRPDLNLLAALDVLLAEGSVVRAAKRLQLSASARSRTLARLREATGDPLLVRAGRGLVPSPRAVELRERVARLVQDADAVLRPSEAIDLERLDRSFTLRTSDGFVETFGPGILDRVAAEAPRVRLRFVQKPHKDSAALREGHVDLETGVVDRSVYDVSLAHARHGTVQHVLVEDPDEEAAEHQLYRDGQELERAHVVKLRDAVQRRNEHAGDRGGQMKRTAIPGWDRAAVARAEALGLIERRLGPIRRLHRQYDIARSRTGNRTQARR